MTDSEDDSRAFAQMMFGNKTKPESEPDPLDEPYRALLRAIFKTTTDD